MDPLLELLRKGTEYGLSPPLLIVLAVVWLAWKFPGVRAALLRPLGGNGTCRTYVTQKSCHDAMDRLINKIDASAKETRTEIRQDLGRIHQRMDKHFDR
jgi:hypothetical protein